MSARADRIVRHVRDSHRRWQLLSDLSLGVFVTLDGLTLVKCAWADLYQALRHDGRFEFFHPSWFR